MSSHSQLSPGAYKRALTLKLGRIRRKMERLEVDLAALPPERPDRHDSPKTPSLFSSPKLDEKSSGATALRQQLAHLRSRENQILAKLRGVS